MAASASNIELGLCKVYFNGVDMGHTIGDVTLKYSPTYHVTRVGRYAAPVKHFLQEEEFKATVPLAEKTIANIKAAMATATQSGNHLTFGSKAGKDMSSAKGLLRLHPIELADNDESKEVVFFKAMITNEVEIAFSNSQERIMEVEFTATADEDRPDGANLAVVGDSLN